MKSMRIGIDAKWFFTGPPSTRTTLQNLLPCLFDLYPQHEWIIFFDRKDRHLALPFKQTNITPLYVWAENNMLSNIFILPGHVRKAGVDVMVYQTFPPFKKNIRSIAFIHDVLFKDFPKFFTLKERLYFRPLLWLTPSTNRLIATTNFVAKELVKYKYARSSSQIDIVPLGVSPVFKPLEQHDTGFLKQVKEKFRLPKYFILFTGRLNIRKNIEGLLRAIPLLHDKNIALVIVGKEDGRVANLTPFFSDPELQKRVMLTGSMKTEELAAVYALSKIFCFPSFAEGFGLPPLEAMASGVPVVVSNTTALPEVCGDAAVYIDPRNPPGIASALNDLMEDPQLYIQKRRAGIAHAAGYKWDDSAHQFMQSVMNAVKNNMT